MKLVVDTNVFISGIFFTGPPNQILNGWRDGKWQLVVSEEILTEYNETAIELSRKYASVDLSHWIEFVVLNVLQVEASPLPQQVCSDLDDDMFLACAKASGASVVLSGENALLATSGYEGIHVCSPRAFSDEYL